MLTRNIDLDDTFDLIIGEKFFLNARRLCIVLAIAALALSGFDLLNAHALGNATDYARHMQMSSLARAVDRLSFTSASPAVVVVIPADATVAVSEPISALAAARHEDAVKLAMLSPPMTPVIPSAKPPPQQAVVASPPAATPAAPTVKRASINPSDPPQAAPITPTLVLPAKISVLPRRPPPMSPAQRLNLHGASRANAERCLARAIYFEARDQPFRGQVAVAQVVFNRVFSGIYPRDVCGVIYQNASHHLACQFTFACDGKRKVINERGAWARARRIARETLDGKLYVQAVGTATHYHAVYVRPYWVREMRRLVREGSHTFYRPIAWGSGADLPIYSRAELATNHKRR